MGVDLPCAAQNPDRGGVGGPRVSARRLPDRKRRAAVPKTPTAHRHFERPQFAPPPPFNPGGGRHGAPPEAQSVTAVAAIPGIRPRSAGRNRPTMGRDDAANTRSGDELRDKLRATDLIAPRKIESSSGWRKAAIRR